MPSSLAAAIAGRNLLSIGLNLTDDALITFSQGTDGQVHFHDEGYMPITQLTVGGLGLPAQGFGAGYYIHYTGDGIQKFGTTGAPSEVDYTKLSYEIVSYTGNAQFSPGAVTGAQNQVTIAHGGTDAGQLLFGADGSISGVIDTSLKVGGVTVGELDLSVQHKATDVTYLTDPTSGAIYGLTLIGGSLHATFIPNSGR